MRFLNSHESDLSDDDYSTYLQFSNNAPSYSSAEFPRTMTNQNFEISVNNSILKLTNAIENTFNILKNSSNVVDNSTIINCKSSKKLPEFSGDLLDWLYFKQTFDSSTQLGRYTEQENVTRLYEALKGDAKNDTKTLFASGNKASDIMYNLELQFDSENIILEKIVNSTKQLPNLISGKVNLIEFVANLKNTVDGIKSLNDADYINSPEFLKEILLKLPNSLLQDYKRYTAVEGISKLEKLAEFMIGEAKLAYEAGIVTLHSESPIDKTRTSRSSKPKLTLLTNVINTNNSEIENCSYCQQGKHNIAYCKKLLNQPMRERWRITRDLKLCYNCLKTTCATNVTLKSNVIYISNQDQTILQKQTLKIIIRLFLPQLHTILMIQI